jgi:pimeloyl-ACP methyl ester carboxylesterase
MTTEAQTTREASRVPESGLIAWLGWSCMAAAVLTGIGKGVWETMRPVLINAETFATAPRAQLWAYGLLEVIKSAGFLAGLFGFYLCATRRGRVVRFFMGLAVAGGAFFSAVWLMMAVTGRFTIIYVLGGMWYQMVAPVALGIAALAARRVARWKAVLVIVVGIFNSQIFPLLGAGRALLVQGLIWLALGYVVYACRGSYTRASVKLPPRGGHVKSSIRYLSIFCAFTCACASVSAGQTKPARQSNVQTQFVDVGGYKLRMQVAGAGTPTVVLDYGLGDRLEVWDAVFPEIARFARVVAYDRAGYGKSEPGAAPRSYAQIATELHTMLHRAGIAPPYVLVGHSFGGANIRAFAYLFKDEVAGLVFVDPINENIFTSQTEKEREAAIAQQEEALKGTPAGVQGEWKFLKGEAQNNFPQMRSFGAPPDVPLMVLVAGRGRPPHWVKSVLDEYGTWVAQATEGGLVVTPESRHAIQSDDPALVISAVRRVVFPSVQNALERAIKEKGVDAAIALYRRMRQRYPAEYFYEQTLNTLGYAQLNARHVPEAIALFKLNVEMYPNASNPYDSLGEAYMAQGDRAAAITNYRKSLVLNPNNTNAVDMLKKLGATP